MSKRTIEDTSVQVASKAPFGKLGENKFGSVNETAEGMGEFEDPWEDEYETESEEEL
ncbi:5944_t:CDS:2 [Funneliformis caledonium]|uniref:5944_t:CDS:1 n=2 Tax=Funneliformis TaxID=1117308 RepID=A0A9N8Z4X3_9GLOM|nr:5944_t:CDS:2 [Funneliformis caledonium]CAG8619560.1 1023_t:CDS:2 [Funneliformis mosseae]